MQGPTLSPFGFCFFKSSIPEVLPTPALLRVIAVTRPNLCLLLNFMVFIGLQCVHESRSETVGANLTSV